MDPTRPARTCSLCGAALTLEATACNQCGLEAKQPAVSPQSPTSKWYHSIWVVLALIFFVLGPAALPMIWKNPTLSQSTKLVLTLVTLLYTGALVIFTMRIVQAAMGEMGQLNTLFQ